MSRETLAHLNTQTLIGYTSKRGQAWHYRAEDQGSEPNHYEHAVPVADVRRRLFNWTPVEADIQAVTIDQGGVTTYPDGTRKAIVRPDTGAILGVFRTGYQVHDYQQWLISNVEGILDADLHIGSAGLLRGGAVAWVQVEMADTLSAAGVEFRPFLTATTSLDGSIATTYQTGAQVVVCDNTLSAALNSADTRVKVRHSANSLAKLAQVRDALGIVHQVADNFTAHVERLTNQPVTDAQWTRFLTAYCATDDAKASKRALMTRREQSDQLNRLWTNDQRVAPWHGTAYGVLAAANTYAHHLAPVRGATRTERNAERLVTGKVHDLDSHTLQVLAAVQTLTRRPRPERAGASSDADAAGAGPA
jgi:phage/plasmid-like protein (TIGR03299 family)